MLKFVYCSKHLNFVKPLMLQDLDTEELSGVLLTVHYDALNTWAKQLDEHSENVTFDNLLFSIGHANNKHKDMQ